jgi:hypothetical protein
MALGYIKVEGYPILVIVHWDPEYQPHLIVLPSTATEEPVLWVGELIARDEVLLKHYLEWAMSKLEDTKGMTETRIVHYE